MKKKGDNALVVEPNERKPPIQWFVTSSGKNQELNQSQKLMKTDQNSKSNRE